MAIPTTPVSPTIIIGIGSSGLYILENIQRFYQDIFKKSKPDHVEMIYIETNKDNRVGITSFENHIQRIFVSLNGLEKMVEEYKELTDAEWTPEAKDLLDAGLGAGGVRACGRLAMFGQNQEGDNFRNIMSAIKTAYDNVCSPTHNKTGKNKPTVFVTGTLTGGTCSGMFIDMGYLIRDMIGNIETLFGLFLIPANPQSIRGYENYYGNCYASFVDLEYFNNKDVIYEEKWPNAKKIKSVNSPYELVQFISQDYYDGSPAIRDIKGLYKMAGLYLFLNMIGMEAKRMDRLVDWKDNGIYKYGTFGLSAIQFPKGQIQEYTACDMSIALLKRWIDSDKYVLNDNIVQLNKTNVEIDIAKAWDEIIENAFIALNNVGGNDMIREIEEKAKNISDKTINEASIDYIIKLFNSKSDLHGRMNNNLQTAANTIIDDIYELVTQKLNQTENLYYAKFVLEGLVKAITNMFDYWKGIGISSKVDLWDDKLRGLATDSMKNTYNYVFEGENIIRDRLLTIFEFMKMHLMVKKLVDICNNISKENIDYASNNSQKILPRIGVIDRLIEQVGRVIGNKEDKEGILTFERRKSDILYDINDVTIPILRIYSDAGASNFNNECTNAMSVFIQRQGQYRKTKDVIESDNLWEYLNKMNSISFYEELYENCLSSFSGKIIELDCIKDVNVSQYILAHREEAVKFASKSTQPFISLNKTLQDHAGTPKFMVGANQNELISVANAFKKDFDEFSDGSPNRILELRDLSNIIVFYKEKGGFKPLEHLKYIDQMKDIYDNGGGTENKEDWQRKRNAYIKKSIK